MRPAKKTLESFTELPNEAAQEPPSPGGTADARSRSRDAEAEADPEKAGAESGESGREGGGLGQSRCKSPETGASGLLVQYKRLQQDVERMVRGLEADKGGLETGLTGLVDLELHRAISERCRVMFLKGESASVNTERNSRTEAAKKVDFMNKLNRSYGLRRKKQKMLRRPKKLNPIELPKEKHISFENAQAKNSPKTPHISVSPLKMLLSREYKPAPLAEDDEHKPEAKGPVKGPDEPVERGASGSKRPGAELSHSNGFLVSNTSGKPNSFNNMQTK